MADEAVREESAEPRRLLPLREDIHLMPGTRSWSGEPTWTLADPVRNRFFQLGDRDVQILRHWQEGTVPAVVAALAGHDGVVVEPDEVEALQGFLLQSELLDTAPAPLRQRLVQVHQAREQSLFKQLLHKYLFFRIPLVRPDRFLDRLYPRVRFLFQPWFPRLTALVGLLGVILMAQGWERVAGGFGWFLTPLGILVFALTLVGVKLLHELGHALTCKHYGLRVPTMGVAFLVLWPVMYTDASEGWRLVSRWQRARIAAAGVMTELMLASYAMVAWFFLPDGLARSIALAIATWTWVLSIVVNLNPLMRFDGYYFLSDFLNVPNLQDRSFALARSRLRRWLFGLEEESPEHLPPRLMNFMTGYAWAVGIYRFFLFLGIALLVYYMFFKALGVLLFMVEIWWFIARPVWSEVRHWRELAPQASLPRRGVFAGVGLCLLALLAFPWQSSVELPALLSAKRYARFFTPADARILAVHAVDGQAVRAGQPLVEMESPELTYMVRQATSEAREVEATLGSAAMDATLYQGRLVMEQELVRAVSRLQGLEAQRARLTVTAPFAGVVRDIAEDMVPGQWRSADSQLLTLVSPGVLEVVAWVSEGDRDRVREGAMARFRAEGASGPQLLRLRVEAVERVAVRSLDPPYHASLFGGDIPVREGEGGGLEPEQALYRLRLAPVAAVQDSSGQQRWRGHVVIEGERRSLLLAGIRRVLGVLIRESGF